MNDYDYNYNQNPEPPAPGPSHSGMETAAIILGILALVGSTCFYLSIPCGAVGVLLALLSRGKKEHLSGRAKTGLLISAAGLVLTISLTTYTLYHYKDLFSSSEFQQKLKDYMEYYYPEGETESGESSDILKDFFGNDGGSTPETEAPSIDDTPYGSDPYSGSSPYETNPYGGSSPYGNSPYGGSPYGNNPYGGNSSPSPGPAI